MTFELHPRRDGEEAESEFLWKRHFDIYYILVARC